MKDESNNAASFNPYDDDQVIINISVWEAIASLEHFTYETFHSDFLRRRKEWFQKYGNVHYALWWIKAGAYPSIESSIKKLEYLQAHGETENVFSFKKKFSKPTI